MASPFVLMASPALPMASPHVTLASVRVYDGEALCVSERDNCVFGRYTQFRGGEKRWQTKGLMTSQTCTEAIRRARDTRVAPESVVHVGQRWA